MAAFRSGLLFVAGLHCSIAIAQSNHGTASQPLAQQFEGEIHKVDGRIKFSNARLGSIVREFADANRVEFTVTQEASSLRFSGELALGDIDRFMSALTEVLPVRVTRESQYAYRIAVVVKEPNQPAQPTPGLAPRRG
ncbi:hypothetical protein [Actomonas aquatica]|uniref:Secretin/TonB short N-terminal domain-containing protein n=1 Tax=Actomonas aquatica TaxID=2866162 RepID=A0ABZ1CBM2_9BACT|nr:hypothetical protein [Opitutus sp. WL0086]WRQ88840.1 hypothetical protein K1X11_005445 [Opitutus sp. WL0086]WRQ88846.1 hypothetical protein K1X11_005475 [Opitutus sp. WL0086]